MVWLWLLPIVTQKIMIASLKGKISEGIEGNIIVDVNNVGYQVRIPTSLVGEVTTRQDDVQLFIHTHVREDALDLYGFLDKNDLYLFKMLINVSGIGPKTAINILSAGADGVRKAVVDGDVSFFTSIPKVGTKNAQKIIIELKSKLGSIKELDLTGKENQEMKEIVEVLVGMGFSQKESYQAVKKIPKDLKTLEEKIRSALKLLK